MSIAIVQSQEPWIPWNDLSTTEAESADQVGPTFLDTNSWPPADGTYLDRTFNDPAVPNPSPHEAALDIKVSDGRKAHRWLVHQRLLCHYSLFFQSRFQKTSDERHLRYELHEEPIIFKLFLDWLYSDITLKQPPDYDDLSNTSWSWKLNAAEAYFLSIFLQCNKFQRYCLAMVRQAIGDYDLMDMEYIYTNATQKDSPLRKFCNDWVTLRNEADQRLWKSTTNEDIKALFSSDRQTAVRDPRVYDIGHWFACKTSASRPNSCRHRHQSLPDIKAIRRMTPMPKLSRFIFKYHQRPLKWKYLLHGILECYSEHRIRNRLHLVEQSGEIITTSRLA